MPQYLPSIKERLDNLIQEMDGCASCGGGMSAGDGGFSGDADSEGPVAGYDPVMGGKVNRRKKKREGVNEGKKPLPDFKMILKAGNLENKEEDNKDKVHRNAERARKIRSQIK